MAKSGTNLLSIPLKTTSHLPSLTQALKDVLLLQYDDDPELYSKDIQTFQALRNRLVGAEPTYELLQDYLTYWQELDIVCQKFPSDIGIDFTWTPAFGAAQSRQTANGLPSLAYERLNVLFNFSALYSNLAASENRADDEGLKRACALFQNAAGCVACLMDMIPDIKFVLPSDLTINALQVLRALLLAQAQECFWQRAAKDRMKDATIAKLAATTSEFYETAHDHASSSANLGLFSTAWLSHILMKHHHFAAAAQFRKACEALTGNKYGEEIARLQAAQQSIEKGRKVVKAANIQVANDFQTIVMAVAQALSRAERDNDLIYLDPVPPLNTLHPIAKAEMVKGIIPSGIQKFKTPSKLFQNLLPYPVHAAITLYKDRKDNLCEGLDKRRNDMNLAIQSTLQELNLPSALDAVEASTGLPHSVVTRGDEVRNSGGTRRLYDQIRDISQLSLEGRHLLEDCFDVLESIPTTSNSKSRVPGKLNARAVQLQKNLEEAALSDVKIRERLDQHKDVLEQLSSGRGGLADCIPSKIPSKPMQGSATNELRVLIDKLENTKWEAQGIVQAAQGVASVDSASLSIRREAIRFLAEQSESMLETAHFDSVIEKSLSGLDIYKTRLVALKDRQDALLLDLAQAHTKFEQQKAQDSSNQAREIALKRLDTVYITWEQISRNLAEALKFYNQLKAHLTTLYSECQDCLRNAEEEASREAAALVAASARLQIGDGDANDKAMDSITKVKSSSRDTRSSAIQPGEWKGGNLSFG